MSFAIPEGTPIPATPATQSDVFDCIPQIDKAEPGDQLPSLFPSNGGRPGLTYLLCPVAFLRKAQDAGWNDIEGPIRTVRGPLGQVDCRVLAYGQIIPGTDPNSGRRVYYVHRSVPDETGLSLKTGFAASQEELDAMTDPGPDPSSPATPKATPKKPKPAL